MKLRAVIGSVMMGGLLTSVTNSGSVSQPEAVIKSIRLIMKVVVFFGILNPVRNKSIQFRIHNFHLLIQFYT